MAIRGVDSPISRRDGYGAGFALSPPSGRGQIPYFCRRAVSIVASCESARYPG